MASGGLDIQISGFREAYRALDRYDRKELKKRFTGAFRRVGE